MGQRCRPTCNPCLIGRGFDGEIITTSFLGSGSVVNVLLDPYSEYGSGSRYNMLNTVLCNPQFFNNSAVVIKNYLKFQPRQRKRLDPDPFSDFLLGPDLFKSTGRIRIRNSDYQSCYPVSGVPKSCFRHWCCKFFFVGSLAFLTDPDPLPHVSCKFGTVTVVSPSDLKDMQFRK